MDVDVTLTVEDLTALERCRLKARQPGRRTATWTRLWPWLLTVLFLVCFLVYPQASTIVMIFAGGVMLGAVLGGIAAGWLFVRLKRITVHNGQEFARDPRNRWLFTPHQLRISRDGVAVEGAGYRTLHAWELVSKIEAAAEHCFLFTSSTAAHIVPKRSFADEKQFVQFVVLAHQFKDGRRTTDIATQPLWKLPQGPTGLFDPNSSY